MLEISPGGGGGGLAHCSQLLRAVLRGGLEGHVLGHAGSLPDVYDALRIETHPCLKVFDPYKPGGAPVPPPERGQELLLIIGTMSTYGKGEDHRRRGSHATHLRPPRRHRPHLRSPDAVLASHCSRTRPGREAPPCPGLTVRQ
ncbi:hypothetical protein ACP4OV_022462 [Aristida adscensionis]